ncbi:DUF4334 domain-containing protein [Luteococcus sp. OSA5]|uniref:DUF4334 domain-containing protein n=1 Tax=Luteococcus sp. OSA5 TaxID=3401630 RepID=UPI003B42B64A
METPPKSWPKYLRGTRPPLELRRLFASAEPVAPEELTGRWRGAGIASGHPLDGFLEMASWYGKQFDGPNDVHPLLMRDNGGVFPLSPTILPWGAVPALASIKQNKRMRRVAHLMAQRGLLRPGTARRPGARLRLMEWDGIVSTAMIYDALPVQDHFRWVEEDVLLGAMDARGYEPFFFMLQREPVA